jgi:hypothetical protein
MCSTLKSNFWYEITYTNGELLIFHFLDTTADGQARCRLCNGQETLNVFSTDYLSLREIGRNCPC